MFAAFCLLLAPAPELPVSVFVHVARKKASNANLVSIDLESGRMVYDDGRAHRLKMSPKQRALLATIRDTKIDSFATSVQIAVCAERPYDWVVISIAVKGSP